MEAAFDMVETLTQELCDKEDTIIKLEKEVAEYKEALNDFDETFYADWICRKVDDWFEYSWFEPDIYDCNKKDESIEVVDLMLPPKLFKIFCDDKSIEALNLQQDYRIKNWEKSRWVFWADYENSKLMLKRLEDYIEDDNPNA